MFSIKLKNFRSFQDEEFNFSKINILIGENSSGKSSLLKFILALKQTLLPPNNRETNLALVGEYFDLGSFKESVYYHDDQLPIEMTFCFNTGYSKFFAEQFGYGVDENDIELSFLKNLADKFDIYTITEGCQLFYSISKELDKHHSIITKISNTQIGNLELVFPLRNDSEKKLYFVHRCTVIFIDSLTNEKYEIKDVEYDKDGFMTIVAGFSLKNQIKKHFALENDDIDLLAENSTYEQKEKIEQVELLFHKIAYLLITQNYLRYYLEKVDYVNPINTHPSRVYLYRDEKQLNSIKDVEDVVEYFSKSRTASTKLFQEFNNILKTMGIAEEIEIIKDSRLPVRELRVKVEDLLSNISDVGYGVSLQLPILLKALISERIVNRHNSILLIEQPEVHLHPQLHAKLIETLISLSENTVYFIETHSEHIVRKLQSIVKNKNYNISSSDVTIHYLKRINKKTLVSKHSIIENGRLFPAFPSGFFDNSYNLSKELLD